MRGMNEPRVQFGDVLRQLPQHPHDLPREVVHQSQRVRMMEAVTEAVYDRGLSNTRVSDVIERAGVSRRTFYEHFSDLLDCFLQTFDFLAGEVAESAIAFSRSAPRDPEDRIRAGTQAHIEFARRQPVASRVFTLDALAAGPRALEIRDRMQDAMTELLDFSEGVDWPSDDVRRDFAFRRAAIAMMWEIVTQELRRREDGDLDRVDELVVDLLYRLFQVGPYRC
jgi:AcrR family transcriptional regulator